MARFIYLVAAAENWRTTIEFITPTHMLTESTRFTMIYLKHEHNTTSKQTKKKGLREETFETQLPTL